MNFKIKLINNWKRQLNLWNQLLKLLIWAMMRHLIKIGSTLDEKERKDLKKLLTEFQEVFAWSYEDMPRIDPEIAQHHIDTHAHMVPVKKKLRRMRTLQSLS